MKVLITCAVLLAGCAPHILTTPPERDSAVILFKIVDELPSMHRWNSAAVNALAVVFVRYIFLKNITLSVSRMKLGIAWTGTVILPTNVPLREQF